MEKIDKIIQKKLCLGCGLCETIGKDSGYKMKLYPNGFYTPTIPKSRNKEIEERIIKVCPAINIKNIHHNNIWGKYEKIIDAYSSDEATRYKGSSGGIISTLSIYLIENKHIDAILHIGVNNDSYIYNSLKVSKTKSEILNNASSRYAPALVFDKITEILEKNSNTYCFIGKPCDIQGIKLFLKIYPKYSNRIKFFIAIFCAGMPSYNATQKLIDEAKNQSLPISVKYRGEGWPGNFKVVFKDGNEFETDYSHSWGNVLGKNICYRCKICPDGIGVEADISVGDAWNTTNGYPDFNEQKGHSFVMIRNKKADDIITKAIKDNMIKSTTLDPSEINNMQPYQYKRRSSIAYKLIPITVLSGSLFNYNLKNLCKLSKKYYFFKGIVESIGSLKRYYLNNR